MLTVDSMASRRMFADRGIRVIQDAALSEGDTRILVSSREPSAHLRRSMTELFLTMESSDIHLHAEKIAEATIDKVVEVCGKKILGSASSERRSLEIVGIAAASVITERAIAQEDLPKPIWFSLDDNRAFLGLAGKMADALALAITRDAIGSFDVHLKVVEAKCINSSAQLAESKSSIEQTEATVRTLRTNFCDQEDKAARETWGLSLLRLMALRPENMSFFENPEDAEAFRTNLVKGEIRYSITGYSVMVVHDDCSHTGVRISPAATDTPNVWQYRLGQDELGNILGTLMNPPLCESLLVPTPEDNLAPTSASINRKTEGTTTSVQEAERWVPAIDQEDNAQLETVERTTSTLNESIESQVETGRTNTAFHPSFFHILNEIYSCNDGEHVVEVNDEFAEITAKTLQSSLIELGMHAAFHEERTTTTPNGVLVSFRGHATLTVKRLESKLSELKTTYGLNVTDVRAGLGRVSLFVAASERSVVELPRVWLNVNWPSTAPTALTSFLLGVREDNGEPLWLNLQDAYGGNEAHAPHTLIAGETGSGKGVLTQNLLLQMIALNLPAHLKLYVIDPKYGVDYSWINNAPHLARPIVTTQKESEEVLEEVVAEMERRYTLFRNCGSAKISEFNSKMDSENRLPIIVVIHDEMADWMASSEDYKKVIQSCCTRLASKARAAGIHVIMITQRAAQDAIPVGIRDNLGNRLCLKVAGDAGSRLALGVPGAEKLLGKGHLAARLGGDRPVGDEYFIAQVPFASADDLQALASAVTNEFAT